ncbi:TPA: type VI secretion system-associated FHA domain protein TagH [Proteus mirabilis]|nr:type VI secretion system-associated FHA domain protein TagH [Proteus mirabilis]
MRLIIIRTKDNETLSQNYCDFQAPTGTIGRGVDNTLVLPDATRAISRLQATVDISATNKGLITGNKSTLPLILNGNTLPQNTPHPLSEGDILSIGDYQLKVTYQHETASTSPLIAKDVVTPTSSINDAIWDELEAEFPSTPLSSTQAVSEAEINNDPTHPLFNTQSEPLTQRDPLLMSKETSLSALYEQTLIPESLFEQEEVFSQPTIMKDTTPSVLQAPPDFSLSQETTDEKGPTHNRVEKSPIFSQAGHNLASEWSLNSPLLDDYDDENGNSDLADLFKNNAVPLTPALDNFSQPDPDDKSWSTPPTQQEPEPFIPASPHESGINEPFEHNSHITALDAQEVEEDTLFSLDGSLFHTIPEEKEQREKKEESLVVKRARMGIDPVAHQPLKKQQSTSQEHLKGELGRAFIAGLGLDDIPNPPELSPEQLHQAGKLLSLFSQGTVALLSSRHLLKQGINAEMTMILEEGNNPFKLLPSGKTVLMQLFSTPMPGFMEPENAVRDALIDLQAHQLGMIAGVKAILTTILEKFSPVALEKQATEQGYLTGKKFFLSRRKNVLWNVLKAEHKKMEKAVDSDFYTLFSEAFLPAYDLEVRQYRASQNSKES